MLTGVHANAELLLCKLAAKSEVDPVTGCVIWKGSRNGKGYGGIRVFNKPGGTLYKTHRLSYELHKGPIPEGLDICHRCDCPPCWNPDHLFAATNLENRLDSARKGRTNRNVPWARGENNVTAKLTWAKVDSARTMIAAGKSDQFIGGALEVRPGTINFIRRGITWKPEHDPRILQGKTA